MTTGNQILLIVTLVLMTLGLFAFDTSVELGVAGGVPYVVVVCMAYFGPHRWWVWAAAAVCLLLTALGYVISPHGGEEWKVLLNRGLAFLAIATTASFADVAKRINRRLSENEKRLEAIVAERTTELRQANEELRRTNRDLEQFVYAACHDLRSPLNGIRQLTCWIEEDSAPTLGDKSKENLDRLNSRVHKMDTLLRELLAYSRVGQVRHEIEPVDVRLMIAGVVESLDNPEGVEVRLPDDAPTIHTFRAPFEEVTRILIENAIRHNHRGQEGLVEIDWAHEGQRFRLAVRDNGPGIDAANHDRVFQIYQRVGDPSVEGTGMGLAIVKKQIENLGCDLSLESSLGDGATFEFTWPNEVENAREVSYAVNR